MKYYHPFLKRVFNVIKVNGHWGIVVDGVFKPFRKHKSRGFKTSKDRKKSKRKNFRGLSFLRKQMRGDWSYGLTKRGY